MYCLSVEDMYDINYSLILVCTNEYWKFVITETFFWRWHFLYNYYIPNNYSESAAIFTNTISSSLIKYIITS